eukprot:8833437-Pyramimonas_sp.AAC.1
MMGRSVVVDIHSGLSELGSGVNISPQRTITPCAMPRRAGASSSRIMHSITQIHNVMGPPSVHIMNSYSGFSQLVLEFTSRPI